MYCVIFIILTFLNCAKWCWNSTLSKWLGFCGCYFLLQCKKLFFKRTMTDLTFLWLFSLYYNTFTECNIHINTLTELLSSLIFVFVIQLNCCWALLLKGVVLQDDLHMDIILKCACSLALQQELWTDRFFRCLGQLC